MSELTSIATQQTHPGSNITFLKQPNAILVQKDHRIAGLLLSGTRLHLVDTAQQLTAPGSQIRAILPTTKRPAQDRLPDPPQTASTPQLVEAHRSEPIAQPIQIALVLADDWWPTQDDPQFFTDLLNTISNWVFERNGIGIRIKLHLAVLSTKSSSVNIAKDIKALESNKIDPDKLREYLDENSLQPHVVAWLGNYPRSRGGKARPRSGLLRRPSQPSYLAVDSRAALEKFTLLHELGHLLGLGHQSNDTSSCKIPPDARGFVSKRGKWHTIMAVPQAAWWKRAFSFLSYFGVEVGSVRLPIWSGAEVEYPGESDPYPPNNAKYLRRLSGT